MTKLVIVVGDYGGGTVEDALEHKIPLNQLVSADSADARVFNEIIAQDPTVNRIITLPVASQFNPHSAGVITRDAVKWAFDLLDDPEKYPEYKDVTEISIVANVAPGIKSLQGNDVGQGGSNLDREAFVTGTVTKGGRKIVVGSTNAFLDGEGHTLGPLTELEEEGYTLSAFRPIGGEFVKQMLVENGQFRSRWALAYMNAQGEKAECLDVDVLPTALEQHAKLTDEQKIAENQRSGEVFKEMKNFLPVMAGDPAKGFVTVISDSKNTAQKMEAWQQHQLFDGMMISGLSFDGNETVQDKAIIAKLAPEQQENYRLTRQAYLASVTANEFSTQECPRQIVIDSADSPLTGDASRYAVRLNNGARIFTTNPKILALTTESIASVMKDGEFLQGDAKDRFMAQAWSFRDFLADKAIENDPYRNIKLATPFGKRREEIATLLGDWETPKDKAIELTIVARTGDFEEERTIYCTPHSVGSFGMWGHPKISAGSTVLDTEDRNKLSYQAEIFTAGAPTAGNVFTAIPGVTTFEITNAQHIDLSLLEAPGTKIIGKNRYNNQKEGVELYDVFEDSNYNPVHGKHVNNIIAAQVESQKIQRQ